MHQVILVIGPRILCDMAVVKLFFDCSSRFRGDIPKHGHLCGDRAVAVEYPSNGRVHRSVCARTTFQIKLNDPVGTAAQFPQINVALESAQERQQVLPEYLLLLSLIHI